MAEGTLISEVIDRLEADTSLAAEVEELAFAGLLNKVEECLGGGTLSKPDPKDQEPAAPVRAYVQSVTVEGFRGIGPKVKLELTAGPGLTLVVGRNGSGKSSFAEALELLVTGDNQRWSSRRSKIWKDGWRNLHQKETAEIQAELLIDGLPGPAIVKRAWTATDELEQGKTTFSQKGEKQGTAGALGWEQAVVTYRPFLSYNELGSMLEEGPSKLFDALASILGLEELVEAADSLAEARKSRSNAHKLTLKKLEEIRPLLEKIDDERAKKSLQALKGDAWELDIVEQCIAGGETTTSSDSELALLRALAQLSAPVLDAVTSATGELRAALKAVHAISGTDAEKARKTAEILDRALQLHQHHGDGDCPVCGRTAALDKTWNESAQLEIRRLREEASAADQAHGRVRRAEQNARALVTPEPPALARAGDIGIDASALQTAWRSWNETLTTPVEQVADELDEKAVPLLEACAGVRELAAQKHKEKEDSWRPIATLVAEWLSGAKRLVAEQQTLDHLKAAEKWVRETAGAIRNERFQPIKERVKELWELLRTQSSVDLYDVTFEGRANSRRVNLEVKVDGTDGVALGVMSQGELHSLALSLFLPRATLEASPFRFLFIDDPVQAMDPAKVDGLARVLEKVAKDRQVVVFTHDDRLPQAVRYLGIEAKVIEVQRRAESVVELRTVQSPVEHYLRDARALVRTDELPEAVFRRVVPGLCRQSIEAACLEVTRRRRLSRGESHADVDVLIEQTSKLLPRLALALYDDPGRAGEVLGTLNRNYGPWSADVVQACNKGAHGVTNGDGIGFVRDTEKLVERLLAL
jgi:DNA repair exonuclease SbcCD ATPase subunit